MIYLMFNILIWLACGVFGVLILIRYGVIESEGREYANLSLYGPLILAYAVLCAVLGKSEAPTIKSAFEGLSEKLLGKREDAE